MQSDITYRARGERFIWRSSMEKASKISNIFTLYILTGTLIRRRQTRRLISLHFFSHPTVLTHRRLIKWTCLSLRTSIYDLGLLCKALREWMHFHRMHILFIIIIIIIIIFFFF